MESVYFVQLSSIPYVKVAAPSAILQCSSPFLLPSNFAPELKSVLTFSSYSCGLKGYMDPKLSQATCTACIKAHQLSGMRIRV